MHVTDILRGWTTILAGRTPFLSIEITKECPLRCPGCYAYGEDHLGGGLLLTAVSDFKGEQLIRGVLDVIDRYRPLHVSLVGGEPLVRFRELNEILPQISKRNIYIQLVTSAVRSIPASWAKIPLLTLVVSIDGLQPEHDVRRTPATYDRILKNIVGHQITIHCTITRQMTERPGYLRNFIEFWSAKTEVEKIWMSMFTPQIGEKSYEILPASARQQVISELSELREKYPKLAMPPAILQFYAEPPSDPSDCIFAKTTLNITADLKSRVTPCQFGGNPDCSQCGCIASAGLGAIGRHKLPGGIPLGRIYDASLRVGNVVSALKRSA